MIKVNNTPKYRATDRKSVTAFAVYLGLSLFFFGRALIGHFGDRYIGLGADPPSSMLSIVWMRHALEGRVNPFQVNVIWTPDGIDLAHTAYSLLVAAVLAPISLAIGVVRAYNALALLAPALSGWSAFVLYRRICGNHQAALVGAFMFGFSPFLLGHLVGQTNLYILWFIPLAVYLVLLRLANEISTRRFGVYLALALIAQFGCSLELFATMTLFGGIALALAWGMGDADLRARLTALMPPLARSYAVTALIASPYLYYFFAFGPIEMHPVYPIINSAYPLNFIIPAPVNALGAFGFSQLLTAKTNLYDMTAYIGLPAIFVVCLMAYRRGDEIKVKLPVVMLAVISVLSLGPILFIGGRHALPIPGIVLLRMPLLKAALPARFAAFSFLCIGVIVALWLSDGSYRPATRIVGTAIVLTSIAPNPNAGFWTTNVDTPDFFRHNTYREYLSPDDNVLILPYGTNGNSDLWQAAADLNFRMAGGYLGITPAVPDGYREWPIVSALYSLAKIPDLDRQLKAFLVNKRVTRIIVPDRGAHVWQWVYGDGPASWRLRPFNADERAAIKAFFDPIDPAPIHVGRVAIYRVPLDRLGAYAHDTPAELQLTAARDRLLTLIGAADEYLAQGRAPDRLSLDQAARLELLPRLWLTGVVASNYQHRPRMVNGLLMRTNREGRITLGLSASAPALREMANKYAPYCKNAQILAPGMTLNPAEFTQPILALDFDRAGLRAAAAADARSAIVSAR